MRAILLIPTYNPTTPHPRWEAHIWCLNRQLYLGGFDTEGQAAIAYDLAAIKIKGIDDAQTNFDKDKYASQLDEIRKVCWRAGRGELTPLHIGLPCTAAEKHPPPHPPSHTTSSPHTPHHHHTTDEAGGPCDDTAKQGQGENSEVIQIQVQGCEQTC